MCFLAQPSILFYLILILIFISLLMCLNSSNLDELSVFGCFTPTLTKNPNQFMYGKEFWNSRKSSFIPSLPLFSQVTTSLCRQQQASPKTSMTAKPASAATYSTLESSWDSKTCQKGSQMLYFKCNLHSSLSLTYFFTCWHSVYLCITPQIC